VELGRRYSNHADQTKALVNARDGRQDPLRCRRKAVRPVRRQRHNALDDLRPRDRPKRPCSVLLDWGHTDRPRCALWRQREHDQTRPSAARRARVPKCACCARLVGRRFEPPARQSIGTWKRQFVEAGRAGLVTGKSGPPTREQQLEAEVADLTHALGEAAVEIRSGRSPPRAGWALRGPRGDSRGGGHSDHEVRTGPRGGPSESVGPAARHRRPPTRRCHPRPARGPRP